VPERLRALCEAHKDDADGFKEMGLSWTVALCQQLTASRLVEGLHFYTLNQSANTLEILRRLKLLKEAPRETVQDEDVLEGIFVGKA
jgi:methylenetetrahydrofolate reductase (NADPH)